MKSKQGKSIYADEYADGTLRITIIENIDILDNEKEEKISSGSNFEMSSVAGDVVCNVPDALSDYIDENLENDASLISSISRTKATIYDIVHNMVVEWFGTLTISPEFWVDRNNKEDLKKYLGSWFNNIRKRYCNDLMYLAIPEPHKNGGFHFHVLLGNTGSLRFIESGVKQKKRMVYNLKQWVAGFSNFTKVTDRQRCANYVIKYITKDLLLQSPDGFGKQRYLVSKNIPKVVNHKKVFIPCKINLDLSEIDTSMYELQFNENLDRAINLAKDLGDYDLSFTKNLDLESGRFNFHSTRFFFKRKDNKINESCN